MSLPSPLAPGLLPDLLPTLVAAPGDTTVMVLARDPLATATAVAQVLVGALVVGLLFALVLILFRIYRAGRDLTEAVADFRKDILVERARTIAANVEYVSRSVREESERMTSAVGHLSGRLQQASQRMEERIEEFNALLEVVQGEAEEVFLDTASTVRGVRSGARRLTARDEPVRPGPRRAVAEGDAVDEDDPETGDDVAPLWPEAHTPGPSVPHDRE